jgi:hypothetical protein
MPPSLQKRAGGKQDQLGTSSALPTYPVKFKDVGFHGKSLLLQDLFFNSCRQAMLKHARHTPALFADQMMMMLGKGVRQFIAVEFLLKVKLRDDTQIAEQIDGSIHGGKVCRGIIELLMDFLDAERPIARIENPDNFLPRARQLILMTS